MITNQHSRAAGQDVLQVAQIGVGRWGRNIARTIRDDVPGMRLAAVASTNNDIRDLVGPDCEVHSHWPSLADRSDIHAVFLAVPPRLHVEMTEAFITAGVPVFVEKPLCLSSEDGQRILKVVDRCRGFVHVDHIDLFNPAIVAARNLGASSGRLARISGRIGGNYDSRPDITPLWEYAPHFIAVCIDMLGMPNKISAQELPTAPPFDRDPRRSLVRLLMTFTDGTEADLTVGNAMHEKTRTLAFEYEQARITFDDQTHHKLVITPLGGGQTVPVDISATRPLAASIRAFEAGVRRHEASMRNVSAALDVIRVLEHASRAIGEPLPNTRRINNPHP